MLSEAFKCGNCKFCDLKTHTCHRNAPHPIPQESALWPAVKDEDWCGEFVQAPKFDVHEITKEKQLELQQKYEKYERL
ncbi:MAG: hypothetical protein ACYSSP_05580 [Planctomycetota bacterium]|jgi:hypothetical protein